MKEIGIAALKLSLNCAQALKDQLTGLENAVNVVIKEVEETPKNVDATCALKDLKINFFNAAETLYENGIYTIALVNPIVEDFFDELQTECRARLVKPTSSDYPSYARTVLASVDFGAIQKPFKVGLIGGLGPAATVDLYDKIVKATPAKTDQEHIKLVVEQNPQIPDRTDALLNGATDPTLALYNCAKRLEKDGCNAIIIPCNTAHAFIPYMQRHLKIPFINMQQTALDEIKEKFGASARIGLLATTGTVKTGIYSKKAEEMGLALFTPDAPHQECVMQAIYGAEGVKAGKTKGRCREDLLRAAQYLVCEKTCNVLILGCTELPLILNEGDTSLAGKDIHIVDPTSALARKVVRLAFE